jgi:hypothetical protein
MAMVTQAKHNLRAMSEEKEKDLDLRTPGWSETWRQARFLATQRNRGKKRSLEVSALQNRSYNLRSQTMEKRVRTTCVSIHVFATVFPSWRYPQVIMASAPPCKSPRRARDAITLKVSSRRTLR